MHGIKDIKEPGITIRYDNEFPDIDEAYFECCSFQIERMDDGLYWGRITIPDGQTFEITFTADYVPVVIRIERDEQC